MQDKPRTKFDPQKDVGHVAKGEPELPELTKIRDFDRQMHIQKNLEAGLTREQAEKHADDDLEERVDEFE